MPNSLTPSDVGPFPGVLDMRIHPVESHYIY